MPYQPQRPCSQPCCPELVAHEKRFCTTHQRLRNQLLNRHRPNSYQRGYGIRWRKLRKRFLSRYPFCVSCGTLATEVDHIVPKRDGGTDDWHNLQALCRTCHRRKTATEPGSWTQKGRSPRTRPNGMGPLNLCTMGQVTNTRSTVFFAAKFA